MASIVENKKYGEGHSVVLKDKIPGSMALKLRQFNYTPGKDIFNLPPENKGGRFEFRPPTDLAT